MKISKEIIERVLRIARIKVDNEKLKKLEKDLTEVLDYFSKLQEVNVANTKPSFHPIAIESKLREDKEGECLSKKDIFKGKKNIEGDFFIGPEVKT